MKKTLLLIVFIYKSSLLAQSTDFSPFLDADIPINTPGFSTLSTNTIYFSYDISGNQVKRSFEIIITAVKNEKQNHTVEVVDTKLKVYPNPSKGPVSISLPNNVNAVEINLIDIKGSVLGRYPINKAQSNQEINISQLPLGVYILQITTNNGKTLTSKIIKS